WFQRPTPLFFAWFVLPFFYYSFAPRSVTKNRFEAETKGKECEESKLLMTNDLLLVSQPSKHWP
ncbi:MAG: hypothetical protein VW349_09035, partial [Gammaproteobacteria bacterium]